VADSQTGREPVPYDVMVAQASWMEPSGTSDESDDDELWHVAIAPDEVKVLTLEQLDDLFRLDIIDENVRVWQPGMQDWLPLSVVAGMDAEPAPRAAPAPPPAARKPVPVQQWAAPLEPSASPFAATIPASYQSPLAYSSPESIRPIVVSDPPMRTQSSSGARWLVALAVIAGLAVTLHRNGVIRDAASSMGQVAAYQRLERALGAPGFGTLRAVEELTGASLSQASTASLAVPAPVAAPAKPVVPAAPEAAVPERRETVPAAAPKAAAGEPATVSLESLTREAVAKETGRAVKAPKLSRKTSARAARSAPQTAPAKSIGIKGSGHAYDPLNPKL
jgi:hypothetical protein